jgi:hypothetical protein
VKEKERRKKSGRVSEKKRHLEERWMDSLIEREGGIEMERKADIMDSCFLPTANTHGGIVGVEKRRKEGKW